MRIRSAGACLALVAGLSLALAGCGQLNQVRAMKAFKDGNKLYASNDFRGAAAKYEEAVQADPAGELNSCGTSPGCVYFFLANSYDNLYRPDPQGRAGQRRAPDRRRSRTTSWRPRRSSDPMMKTPVARVPRGGLRPRQAERPDDGRADRQADDRARPDRADQLLQAGPPLPGLRRVRSWPSRRCSRPRSPSRTTRPSTCSSPASTTARATSRRRSRPSNQRIEHRAEQPRGPLHGGHLLLGQGLPRLPPQADTREARHASGRASSAVDKAIAIKDDYMEAIAYKNLLLRLQANLEKDPARSSRNC